MAAPSTRSNGGRVTAGWFNDIKTWVQGLYGAGAIEETSFTIANNQSGAASVTGLLFSSASYRSAEVDYEISRKTDTASSEVRCIGKMKLVYRAESSSWEIIGDSFDGDDIAGVACGVTFTVTAAGQVQYESSNIAGSNYAGTIKFRARTWNV
jgi:hypothetical protein